MYLFNNRKINIDSQITIEGVTYPNLRDPIIRQQLGVQWVPDPVRPTPEEFYYVTENEDGSLNITPKPVEQVLPPIYERIKAHRDLLMLTGGAKVVVNGADKWFHSDTHSKTQQLSLLVAGNSIPAGLMWKTMDKSFVEMTPTLAQQVFAAQMTQEASIFAVSEGHQSALSALATLEEIAAYDWKAGWPETYVEETGIV